MNPFEQDIYERNLRQKLAISFVGVAERSEIQKAVDTVTEKMNSDFAKGLSSEDEIEQNFTSLDEILKARAHKYFKREGAPGSYKYYYTEAEYKEAKGEVR